MTESFDDEMSMHLANHCQGLLSCTDYCAPACSAVMRANTCYLLYGWEQLSLFWWRSDYASCDPSSWAGCQVHSVACCHGLSWCEPLYAVYFELVTKCLAVWVLGWTCVFCLTFMDWVHNTSCCALAVSVELRVDAYLRLLRCDQVFASLFDEVNIDTVWTARWAHSFYWWKR